MASNRKLRVVRARDLISQDIPQHSIWWDSQTQGNTLNYEFNQKRVSVHFPIYPEDANGFWEFFNRSSGKLAVDIETSGLDVYSKDFKIRLVQFGNEDEAWVFMADFFPELISEALVATERIFIHTENSFDLLALDKAGFVSLEISGPKTLNTYTLSHLLEPRSPKDGREFVHDLKGLAQKYIDRNAPDSEKALHEVFRKDLKTTISRGWSLIEIDHPTYVLYSGLDTILTATLASNLSKQTQAAGLAELSRYEHSISRVVSKMVRQGMLLDVDYTESLIDRLHREQETAEASYREYGLENANSPKQVAEALQKLGWEPTEFTDTGQPKVDKSVLSALAETGNGLAVAIQSAKKAEHFRTAYAETMLETMDEFGFVHPNISPLKARTARMAISRPPFQQLPSRDEDGGLVWEIRRCLIAEPDNTIYAVDYDTLEMRMYAALADIPLMKQAIINGDDLHGLTASLIWGPGFTKENRQIAKHVGYGKIYGGGAAGISRKTGAPFPEVQQAVKAFDAVYPEGPVYAGKLRTEALANGLRIRTVKGRPLPVDENRIYAATNYVIQSSARDILTDAMLEADKRGLTKYLMLPVHDELLGQAPRSEVKEIANELSEIMNIPDWHGVPITAEAKIGGFSWGSLYGAPDDKPIDKE